MSLIWQQIYAGQMRAQGYKFAYALAEWPDDGEPKIIHGPIEASEGAIDKLMNLDPEHKLVLHSCWIDDEGEIVG